jgi:hypothetical protein
MMMFMKVVSVGARQGGGGRTDILHVSPAGATMRRFV